ncbi:hypothetical protein GZ178_03910, partial [Dermatophilus congolensis]|nr:hypothetical protein [Dermatophilus congolensis]
GALVILHAGNLCAYIERGGRTLLTFGDTTTHSTPTYSTTDSTSPPTD